MSSEEFLKKRLKDIKQRMQEYSFRPNQMIEPYPSYVMKQYQSQLINQMFINLLRFRADNKELTCQFQTPVFIPIAYAKATFSKAYNEILSRDPDEVAAIFSIITDNDQNLFKYFVNVGFANIYQYFITNDKCEKAANVLMKMIEKQNTKLMGPLIGSFVINFVPFISNFVNIFDIEAFQSEMEPRSFMSLFASSFNDSIAFLSPHHISVLQFLINNVEKKQVQEIFLSYIFLPLYDILSHSKQFICSNLFLNKHLPLENIEIQPIFNEINNQYSTEVPNIENTSFYDDKRSLFLTRADALILNLVYKKIHRHHNPLIRTNALQPCLDENINDAFSIFYFDYENISRTTNHNHDGNDEVDVDYDHSLNIINSQNHRFNDQKFREFQKRWDIVKLSANDQGFDPFGSLDLKNPNDLEYNEFVLELEYNELLKLPKLRDNMRKRMADVQYLKANIEFLEKLKEPILLKYVNIFPLRCEAKNFKKLINEATSFKEKQLVSFTVNFLKCNFVRYSKDTNYENEYTKIKGRFDSIEKELHYCVQSKEKFLDEALNFVKSFTQNLTKMEMDQEQFIKFKEKFEHLLNWYYLYESYLTLTIFQNDMFTEELRVKLKDTLSHSNIYYDPGTDKSKFSYRLCHLQNQISHQISSNNNYKLMDYILNIIEMSQQCQYYQSANENDSDEIYTQFTTITHQKEILGIIIKIVKDNDIGLPKDYLDALHFMDQLLVVE
ncbi:hypothetical protein TRFO_01623 [Tritrichomonas foetus]|uniref:Uncharacterized protein n=1 Tax=Tritrichomonas foetus TaxID=1144522 RepID=A0A1J4JU63_9EUKA|nr:hypothetical protein TRFO_01623 [Tritrichomonas foetus]|eukprot:OHT01062.1 hypothetical protein TRFO_01623 [Tritrichomonas foetus]